MKTQYLKTMKLTVKNLKKKKIFNGLNLWSIYI